MKTDYLNHYKEMNPNTNYEQVYNGVKTYYDAEIHQILPYINKNLPAVDIGSGYGYLAKYLLDNGFNDITCVDTSAGLLEIINNWLGSKVKTCNKDGLEYLSPPPPPPRFSIITYHKIRFNYYD
jgi:16S rRNA A1518/A1519 N6-dimethyltransferase RsmA/KsgA/DIM1 with predicted DNA glycosylase/AP lyase activity